MTFQGLVAQYLAVILLTVLLGTFLPASIAHAGVSGYQVQASQRQIYQQNLSDSAGRDHVVLDWRGSNYDMNFTLPDNAWIDGVELLLSARPEGSPHKGRPIFVRFNHGEALPLYGRGQSFDARIRLEATRVKSGLNHLSFSYPPAQDKACVDVGVTDGGWDINLANSQIIVKARSKSRPYSIADVKMRLSTPATAPRKVALIAKGDNAVKLRALGAQAMALNLTDIPSFSTTPGADLELLMGTRRELSPLLSRHGLTLTSGPQMAVISNNPMRIILTGDDEMELMEMVKAFASYAIPSARRTYVTLGEFKIQEPFIFQNAALSGQNDLLKLGAMNFTRGWANDSQSISFRVRDPLNAHGNLTLKLQSGAVSPRSTVMVSLNGEMLGKIALKRSKVIAKLDIPRGLLKGMDNKLTLIPDLAPNLAPELASILPPKHAKKDCAGLQLSSGFALLGGSKINIIHDEGTPSVDLTRLAASGYPFSAAHGASTKVVLTARSQASQSVSYQLIGQLAKTYGTAWTQAQYSDSLSADSLSINTLIIGPNLGRREHALKGAPDTLFATIDGRKTARAKPGGSNPQSMPEIKLLRATDKIVKGGIAALYLNPDDSDHVIGIMTNGRGQSFTKAMTNLRKPEHWDKLQGSIARWDNKQVMMAQTAQIAKVPSLTHLSATNAPPGKPFLGLATLQPKFRAGEWRMRDGITFLGTSARRFGGYLVGAGQQARRELSIFFSNQLERPVIIQQQSLDNQTHLSISGKGLDGKLAPTPTPKPASPALRKRALLTNDYPSFEPYQPPKYQQGSHQKTSFQSTSKVQTTVQSAQQSLPQYKPKTNYQINKFQIGAKPFENIHPNGWNIQGALTQMKTTSLQLFNTAALKIDNILSRQGDLKSPAQISTQATPRAQALIFALIGIFILLLTAFMLPSRQF